MRKGFSALISEKDRQKGCRNAAAFFVLYYVCPNGYYHAKESQMAIIYSLKPNGKHFEAQEPTYIFAENHTLSIKNDIIMGNYYTCRFFTGGSYAQSCFSC